MRRIFAIAGFTIGLAALVLQFFVVVPLSIGAGRAPVTAGIDYFSYFTILTNILLVLVYLGAIVKGQRWLMLFRRPVTRAAAAATITLVGGFYHFFLAGLWEMDGLLSFVTVILHYVTPVLYLFWYVAFNRTGTLKWTVVPLMLAYPVVYLVYVLIRGALIGEYPYPVLDAAALGYAQLAINVLGLLIALLVLNVLAVAADRSLLASKRN